MTEEPEFTDNPYEKNAEEESNEQTEQQEIYEEESEYSLEELEAEVEELEGEVEQDIEEFTEQSRKTQELIDEVSDSSKQEEFYSQLQNIQEQLSTTLGKWNQKLAHINQLLHTDLKTGELKEAFGLPTVDRYIRAQGEEYWNQAEFLQENMRRYLDRIQELAQEKGTWTSEHLGQVEEIMERLRQVPFFHVTSENVDYDTDLYSHREMTQKLTDEEQFVGNTYDEDKELGRDDYVYLSWGNLYMSGIRPEDLDDLGSVQALVMEGSEVHNPRCLMQDQHMYTRLGLSETEHNSEENIYKPLTDSTLLGADYLRVLSTALATGVIENMDEESRPEGMFHNKLEKEKISTRIENNPVDLRESSQKEIQEETKEIVRMLKTDSSDSVLIPKNIMVDLQSNILPQAALRGDIDSDTSWRDYLVQYLQNK